MHFYIPVWGLWVLGIVATVSAGVGGVWWVINNLDT